MAERLSLTTLLRKIGVFDRLITDPELLPDRLTGTVERYFQTWLTEYGREQSLFATLTSDDLIVRKYRDEKQVTYTDITEVVEEYPRFVLIGEPGEGKSTALRMLMAQAIFNFRHSNGQTPLPLWINLGFSENPVDSDDLIRYWWYEQYELPGAPEPYLNRNGMILYLDGLNEMPENNGSRSDRAASLRDLLKRYPHIPVITTCRVREYEDDQDLNLQLPVLRVMPLDERRTKKFIVNQLGAADLWEKISGNPILERLAQVSYRLKMLIDVYQSHPDQALPDTVESLLLNYAKLRYEQNKKAGRIRSTSWETVERALQELAYRMVMQRKGTAIDVRWANRQIGSDALKDGIDLGLLRREGRVVRFMNHVLHGYFAIPLLLQALRSKPKNQLFLLEQIGDLGEAAAPAVQDLMRTLKDKDPLIRQYSAFALGRIGEPAAAAVSDLILALADEHEQVRQFAAFALGRIGEAAAPAVPTLTPSLKDSNPSVRMITALVLRQIGKAAAPAMNALIEALNDANEGVKRLAALTLGQIGAKAAPAVPALSNLLFTGSAEFRSSIAYAMAQIGESAVPALTDALEKGQSDVRLPAANALREIGKSAASAVPALIKTLDDPDIEVRRAAARALERISTPEAQDALRVYYERQPKTDSKDANPS